MIKYRKFFSFIIGLLLLCSQILGEESHLIIGTVTVDDPSLLELIHGLLRLDPDEYPVGIVDSIKFIIYNGESLSNNDLLIVYGDHELFPDVFLIDKEKNILFSQILGDIELRRHIRNRLKNEYVMIEKKYINDNNLSLYYNIDKSISIFNLNADEGQINDLIETEKYIRLSLMQTDTIVGPIDTSLDLGDLLIPKYQEIYLMDSTNNDVIILEMNHPDDFKEQLYSFETAIILMRDTLKITNIVDQTVQEMEFLRVNEQAKIMNLYESESELEKIEAKHLQRAKVVEGLYKEKRLDSGAQKLYFSDTPLEKVKVHFEEQTYDIYLEPGFPGEISIQGKSGVGEIKRWVVPLISTFVLVLFSF